jgi:hypothetical protein
MQLITANLSDLIQRPLSQINILNVKFSLSRRRISSNSVLRLQKEIQNLSIEKVVSNVIRILKRGKDSSSEGRLNVIKNL